MSIISNTASTNRQEQPDIERDAVARSPIPESASTQCGYDTTLEEHRQVLEKLRAWRDWEKAPQGSLLSFPRKKLLSKRPPRPGSEDLQSLAKFFFPPRGSLKASICDFGPGNGPEEIFEREDIEICKLEGSKQEWLQKPSWAKVRWIHVPVGLGFVHDAISKSFMEGAPETGKAIFDYAGPNPACEVLSLRNVQYLQDQLDVFNLLQEYPELIDNIYNNDLGRSLSSKVADTKNRLEVELNFSKLVLTDIPWQLTEGAKSSLLDSDCFTNPVLEKVEEQILWRHARYKDAVLVRDLFQSFHRDDGFVLTISPTAGVNFLDVGMSKWIQKPTHVGGFHDKDASVIEFLRNAYKDSGTKHWPSQTAAWFLVRLITKVLVVPHSRHTGNTIPEIQKAYLPLVRDLKTRRGAPFKRNESVNLVREYITCMDEVTQLYSIYEQKLNFLSKLRKDCVNWANSVNFGTFRDQSQGSTVGNDSDDESSKTMIEQVDWAVDQLKTNHEGLPRTLTDLRNSLDDLFQLRTIEQNELAIIAESNNKAILVFTVVTIIFLPLSFFTSYFGMNVRGINSDETTQGYFWAVCASVTFIIVVFTLVYGFKDRLYALTWSNRRVWSRGQQKGSGS